MIKNLVSFVALSLALLGGGFLLLSTALVSISVLGRVLNNTSINGDFELVEIGVALAIFSFLPWTMLNKGNIIIQLFTDNINHKVKSILDDLAQLVFCGILFAFAFYALLGAYDAYRYNETSQILAVPIWIGLSYGALTFALASVVCLYKLFVKE